MEGGCKREARGENNGKDVRGRPRGRIMGRNVRERPERRIMERGCKRCVGVKG